MVRVTRLMGGLALAVLVACSEISSEGGGPVSITLTADRTTAPVGGEIVFSFEAKGTSISGVIVEYGDGVADSVVAFGAVTAAGELLHTYSGPGNYQVDGRVEDAVRGVARDQLTVTITASPGGL
jgi:hypothetical protein